MRYTRFTYVTCLAALLTLCVAEVTAQNISPVHEPVTDFTLQQLYQEGAQAYSEETTMNFNT